MDPNDNNEFERKSSFLNKAPLYLMPLFNRCPPQNQKKYINVQDIQKREYSISFKHFSEKGVNFVSYIMKENGEIKFWNDLKNDFKLEQQLYFKWMPLVNATPSNWKNSLKHSDTYSQNLILLDHY